MRVVRKSHYLKSSVIKPLSYQRQTDEQTVLKLQAASSGGRYDMSGSVL